MADARENTVSDVNELSAPPVEGAEQASPLPPVITAGQMLKEAREAKGLSLQEIAQMLNLKPAQVGAIEAQDLSLLPGQVFMRGFMRNYAKAVGLDPQMVMAALQGINTETPELTAPLGSGGPQRNVVSHTKSSNRSWVFLVLLLLLIAGGVFAYLKWGGSPTAQKAGSLLGLSAPVAKDLATVVTTPEATPASDHASNTALAPQSGAPGSGSAQPSALPATNTPSEQTPASSSEESNASNTLYFTFKGDAWVEVKDGTGGVIYSGKNKSGMNQKVIGKPPFTLVVGNAKEVTLDFAGKRIDLEPYTKGTVARMTVQ